MVHSIRSHHQMLKYNEKTTEDYIIEYDTWIQSFTLYLPTYLQLWHHAISGNSTKGVASTYSVTIFTNLKMLKYVLYHLTLLYHK